MYNPSSDSDKYHTPGSAATGVPVTTSSSSSPAPLYTESADVPKRRPPLPKRPQIPWSTGLFDCFSDVKNCCITCWCPCITFGQVSEIVDKGSSSCGANGGLYAVILCVTGCACFYSCFYRSKLRQQFALKDAPCGDCCIHCWCESCALCQEYRELQNRGYNMSLGWHGNIERQNRGAVAALAPAYQRGMTR